MPFVECWYSPVQGTGWGSVPVHQRSEQGHEVWVETPCNFRLRLSPSLFSSLVFANMFCPVPLINSQAPVQKEGYLQGIAGSCVGPCST